ncbi:MAG: T9SS type A sorting domain-containing protein [Armatimonadetes bacterium]|nr:T9SS type A sorting domain-containing protein [Armatimonadota bacterium]
MKALLTYAAALLLMTMAAIAQPAPNQPPNGATDLPTDVTLGWRPLKTAASYEVEIALKSDFTQIYNLMATEATTAEAANLNYSTTYYWHVRGIDSEGVATDWSSTQSFTTIASTGIPQPISPEDGATDQPTSVMLQWSGVAGVGGYDVQWSNDPAFPTGGAQTATVTGTTHQLPTLGYGATTYWRVRVTAAAAATPWSRYAAFTTGFPTPDPLSPPLLISPANGQANQPESVILVWHHVAAKDPIYEIEVASDPQFANVAYSDAGVTDTAYALGNLPAGQTFHWRVRADNGEVKSDWSGVFNFSTAPESPISLLAPQLLTPPNNTTSAPLLVTMTWDSIPEASDYEVEIGKDATFESVDTTLTSTTAWAELAGLPNATTYHWRARARSGAATSAWSRPFQFTTESVEPQLPSLPELIAPADGSTGVMNPVQLRWKAASNGQSYIVEISNSGAFAGEQNKVQITSVDHYLDSLPEGTKQWWRVRAANQYGQSEATKPWSFTTNISTPTGVEEEASVAALQVRVYPIPASATMTVQLPERSENGASVTLFTAEGITAITTNIAAGTTTATISTAPLPAGIYWCVICADGSKATRAVVIVK